MMQYNVNSLAEVRAAGLKALSDALGPVGFAKFIQMYEPGQGDYTKEKYEQPEIDPEEFELALQKFMREDKAS